MNEQVFFKIINLKNRSDVYSDDRKLLLITFFHNDFLSVRVWFTLTKYSSLNLIDKVLPLREN